MDEADLNSELLHIYRRVLSSNLDFKGLLNTLIEEAQRLFPQARAEVLLYHERSGELEVVASSLPKEPDVGTTYVITECMSGLAIEQEDVIRIPNVHSPEYEQRYKQHLGEDILSEMVSRIETPVPKRILGVFNIESSEPDVFTENHAQLLRALCEAAAPGFVNARFIQGVMTLRRLDRQIMYFPDQLQSNLQKILDAGLELADDREGQIMIWDKERSQLIIAAATSEGDIGTRYDVGKCISGEVISGSRFLYVDDTRRAPWSTIYQQGTAPHWMQSEVVVRLEGKTGGVLGVFNVERRKPAAFAEDELQLIRTLAGQAQFAISNAVDIAWRHFAQEPATVVDLIFPTVSPKEIPKIDDNALEKELDQKKKQVLQHLFKGCTSVSLSPLGRGWSGAEVFLAELQHPDRSFEPLAVKLGLRDVIRAERDNYENYVASQTGGGRYVRLERAIDHLSDCPGAIAYTLAGGDVRRTRSFDEYFRDKDVTPSKLEGTLDQLFEQNLGLWHSHKGNKIPLTLFNEYERRLSGFTWDRICSAMARWFGKHWNQPKMHLEILDSFPNPITRFFKLTERKHSISSYRCTIHGDLHPGNILVDNEGGPWLIDFASTGKGHILADYAELEAAIKFTLIPDVNLREIWKIESRLLQQGRLRDHIDTSTDHPQLRKVLCALAQIRDFASRAVHPATDMREYYIPLLYYSLNLLRFPTVSKAAKECILASAHYMLEQVG